MTKAYRNWRTSSYTEPKQNCVEVSQASDGTIGVRDTKGDSTTILQLTPRAWADLLSTLRTERR